MSSYSLTKSRAFQYVGILLALATLAVGYWYFSVRASTLNKSPTSSLTSGLVGYWTFDGADISGTTASDRSGNANNGTLTNGPTKTEGKLGQALNFNGPAASQYVAIADPGTASVLDFGSASTITLSAWVRPTDFTTTGGDGGVILMKGATNGTDDANYGLLYSDGCTSTCNVQFSFVSGGSAHIFETDQNVLLLNTWTHISATFTFGTAGSIIIYINGIPQSGTWISGTGSAAPSQTNEALWIGASNYSTGESVDEEFTGSIDEVRLYNRALSAGEVKSLFDLGASDKVNTAATQPGGAGLASGLAGYWKLDENTGTSAGDASTNGNSGTLTNGPTWTTGRIGSAVNFDGTNDEIGVSDAPALDFGVGEAFSYAGWFNLSAVDGNEPLVMKSANDVSQGYGLFIHTTDLFNIMLNDATDDCSDYVDLNTTLTGAWHHYVWSVDTSHISRLYVDGTLRLTTDCSVSGDLSNADDLSLGWMYAGTSQYFSGKQDDVRLYNRVLSADEVGQLYRLTTPTGVDTSLKGYWSFDGSDTLNASSDPQFTDLSGVGYVGYIDSFASSETKLVPGKLGQAVDFENDGSVDNYIFAGPADSLDNATYVSACAWINPESTPGGWAAIMGKGWEFEVTSNNAIELWLPSGGTNGGAWDTPNGSIPFDTWSHVCFTRDFSLTANTPIIYINGSTVSTVFTDDLYTGLIDNASYDLLIGAWRSSGGGVNDYFDGVIDEARVYNRALSATEVKSLYDLGASDKVNSSISQSQGTGRLDSGLALYWPLDAASGTSAVDSSTNGNNGTLTNMEDPGDWVTGQIANALDFDGSNEYVTVADPASGVLDAVGDQYYTLSGWFNRDTATTTDTILAKSNGPADTMGYLVYLDATTDKLVFATRSTLGDNIYETTSAYTAPGWHHFAIIFNIPRTGGNRGQIYIDGSIQNDNIGGGGYAGSIESTRAFVIGAESDGGNPFDGKLDEVRIYNRTLSADEVGQLYRLTSPTGTDTSLKGYWSFNGQDLSGTTAADRSGAGNNGTLTNGPTITEGKLGQALNFDGTNDYVSTDVPVSGDLTLSAWIYPTNGQEYEGIIARPSQYEAGNYRLLFRNGSHLLEYQFTGGSVHTSNSSIPYDQWSYVAVTFNDAANSVVIYVNGVVDYTGTETGSPSTANAYYGTLVGASNIVYNDQYFEGKVDEARIYSRTLSAKEIAALYNMGR